ncbi:LysR substrate-binding domain-containing protein [soil metagenome]
MKSQHLEYFCKVTECGSFSRAAVALGINQSALSRQIHSLERDLGVSLFYRNGRGIVPTEQGTRLYARASKALEELELARREAIESRGPELNAAVIGMTPTLGRILTRPLAERLMAHSPGVRLRFLEGFSGHLLEWLDEGRVDLAIIYESWATHRLQAEALMTERLCLVSSIDAARLPDAVPSAILGRVPLILPSSHHGLRRLLDSVATAQNLTFDIRVEADSLEAILALVKANLGRSVLPEAAVRTEIDRGELHCAALGSPEVTRTMLLATPTNRPRVNGFHEVAQAIREELAALERRD